MSKLSDIVVQMQELGIPSEVYQEATISDALRLVNKEDSMSLVRINGRWAIGRAIFPTYIPQHDIITVRVV